MVPASTIALMILDLILGLVIPLSIVYVLVKKHGCRLKPILIGAAAFIVAVVVLESAFHQAILSGETGALIKGNILYYALYGGIMAGLFEECTRFGVMKWLLDKEPAGVKTGLAYGIGHGGMEMMYLLVAGMTSNIVMSFMINSGQSETLLATTPDAAKEQLQAAFIQLQTIKPGLLMVSIWERLSALVLQISLSVIMWVAVKRGGKFLLLFPAAILFHAFIDACAVLINANHGVIATELIIMGLSIAAAGVAFLLSRKLSSDKE